MVDPFAAVLRAASIQSVWAAPLALAAGAVSSMGPCIAPRFVAIAGLTAGKERRQSGAALFAFIAGLVLGYAALGAAASLLARAAVLSSLLYGLLAVALTGSGINALFRKPQQCQHASQPANSVGLGAVFLLGASFAFVVSPCCTPVIAAVAAYTAASGNSLFGLVVLAFFAVGHALPLAVTGSCAARMSRILARAQLQHAAQTAGAALMLAAGAYYAVLA